jgi:DNA-binding NarL/FixJ family response regulator
MNTATKDTALPATGDQASQPRSREKAAGEDGSNRMTNQEQKDEIERQTIRVLLVHGNTLLRVGLRLVLERHHMQVIGETVLREEILELIATAKPDVVLLDGAFTFGGPYEEYSAAQMVTEMRWVGARRIFVLVPDVSEECLFQFMRAGAAAYERDRLSSDDLVQKVRRVAAGEYLFTEEVLPPRQNLRAESLVAEVGVLPPYEEQAEQELPAPTLLTEREIEILQFVMVGLGNKQIGKVLKISDQTVKNHITTILRKLQAKDRTVAVVKALRLGRLKLADFQRLRDDLAQGLLLERTPSTPRGAALSSREIEVLRCIMRGWTNTKIGRNLAISTNTVQNHMASIKTKLDVQNRTEAVLKARSMGILTEEHWEAVAI